MKVIALDIETANLDMDTEGLTFDNPRMENCVVCMYDSKDILNSICVHPDNYDEVVRKCGGKLGLFSSLKCLYHLRNARNEGYLPLHIMEKACSQL